jgi:hypothetical protein
MREPNTPCLPSDRLLSLCFIGEDQLQWDSSVRPAVLSCWAAGAGASDFLPLARGINVQDEFVLTSSLNAY